MGLLRRLRAELRKLLNPIFIFALGLAVGGVVLLQARNDSNANPFDPGPAPVDFTGCIRIAAMQHTTALGFLLIGAAAGVLTADDAENGTIVYESLVEPRSWRLVGRKIAILVLIGFASIVLSAVALEARQLFLPHSSAYSTQVQSNLLETVADTMAAVPILLFIACLATAVALWSRSTLVTIASCLAAYLVPLSLFQTVIGAYTPARWISELMHLEPMGSGIDYIGTRAAPAARGSEAVLGGLLLAACGILLAIVALKRLNALLSQSSVT